MAAHQAPGRARLHRRRHRGQSALGGLGAHDGGHRARGRRQRAPARSSRRSRSRDHGGSRRQGGEPSSCSRPVALAATRRRLLTTAPPSVVQVPAMGRLTGKVAMVTGSGGEHGFGRAIAGRLASDGADLILTDVERTGVRAIPGKSAGSWGGLDAVADEVRKHGGRALTALADVRSAAQVDAVVARALETFGHIHILVNNAGAPAGPDRAAVVELSEEAWDLVVGINLNGTFLCSRAVARAMLERRVRRRILYISSQWGQVRGGRRAAYRASKVGGIGVTASAAQEVAPARLPADARCPGADAAAR